MRRKKRSNAAYLQFPALVCSKGLVLVRVEYAWRTHTRRWKNLPMLSRGLLPCKSVDKCMPWYRLLQGEVAVLYAGQRNLVP